jgi:hypothetical protein
MMRRLRGRGFSFGSWLCKNALYQAQARLFRAGRAESSRCRAFFFRFGPDASLVHLGGNLNGSVSLQ